MSDETKRKNSTNDSRQTGVWIMLAGLITAILVSGYLLRSNTHHLRYPELLELLAQTRYESYGSDNLLVVNGSRIDDLSGDAISDPVVRNTQRLGKIVVPSSTSPNTTIEFSRPQNIAVADSMIYGTVEMRVLPTTKSEATQSEPERITFRSERTIRNEAEDARLIGCSIQPMWSGIPIAPARFWLIMASRC